MNLLNSLIKAVILTHVSNIKFFSSLDGMDQEVLDKFSLSLNSGCGFFRESSRYWGPSWCNFYDDVTSTMMMTSLCVIRFGLGCR